MSQASYLVAPEVCAIRQKKVSACQTQGVLMKQGRGRSVTWPPTYASLSGFRWHIQWEAGFGLHCRAAFLQEGEEFVRFCDGSEQGGEGGSAIVRYQHMVGPALEEARAVEGEVLWLVDVVATGAGE